MGEAIVRRLVNEGASVAFTYVNSHDKAAGIVAQIESNGGHALAIRADAAKQGAINDAIANAVSTFGRIDILVNNAAISVAGPVEQVTERLSEYDRQIDVNVKAVAEAVRASIKHMPDGGRIINIGSVGGRRIGSPFLADYAATKAAVGAYSRGLAWDLAPRNITVNTVEPGAIDTDMLPADPAIRELYIGAIPLKRLGKPEEIAAMVNFLASAEAGYITGSAFSVDGGINA